MNIDPERLTNLRRRKNLSRPQLAEKSQLSERQIQRLENHLASSKAVRESTLTKLAEGLGVQLGVLTGELPLPEPDDAMPRDEADRVQISAWIEPKTRLEYTDRRQRLFAPLEGCRSRDQTPQE